MLALEQRRTTLATFPAGTPLLVVAARRSGFAGLLAERNDPATALVDLETVAAQPPAVDPAVENVIVDGLDDLDDPSAFLTGLAVGSPQARLFALVANGAHLVGVGAFFAGVPLALGHPLVREEIEPLFESAGWRILALKVLRDESLPPPEALPFAATIGSIVFALADPAMLARAGASGYLVIADPA